jgi:hypothetical protein
MLAAMVARVDADPRITRPYTTPRSGRSRALSGNFRSVIAVHPNGQRAERGDGRAWRVDRRHRRRGARDRASTSTGRTPGCSPSASWRSAGGSGADLPRGARVPVVDDPVRGIAHTRASVLQPGLLLPGAQERHHHQGARSRVRRDHPLPRHSQLWPAGDATTGGAGAGVLFVRYDLEPDAQGRGGCRRWSAMATGWWCAP